ncbi:MAG: S8 family serine peptidase [Mycobacterium leprae]
MAAGRLTAHPVHIGLLDSGVDLQHPLLQGLLAEGYSPVRPGEPPQDENGHGTHVAGIIATAIGDRLGRSDPPPVLLHPVKIFDQTGYGRMDHIVQGLNWCRDNGMAMINLSFGTDRKTSRSLQQAIIAAYQKGILLIGAAGNDGRTGAVDFPGRYPEVLAVAACTQGDELAPFSSSGPEVDLVAPGSGVVSLAPGGTSVRMSGTSMAAPHVTAAAALLLALHPTLRPSAVRERLMASAEWMPMIPARAQGAGLLRADRLLREALYH